MLRQMILKAELECNVCIKLRSSFQIVLPALGLLGTRQTKRMAPTQVVLEDLLIYRVDNLKEAPQQFTLDLCQKTGF
jgi:hypothetical protein